MITFENSAALTVKAITDVLAHVASALSEMSDNDTFNVKRFSEKYASETGQDELLVATVVRSVVNSSEEYTSKRGPKGGVLRTEKAIENRDSAQVELFAA